MSIYFHIQWLLGDAVGAMFVDILMALAPVGKRETGAPESHPSIQRTGKAISHFSSNNQWELQDPKVEVLYHIFGHINCGNHSLT